MQVDEMKINAIKKANSSKLNKINDCKLDKITAIHF